MNTRQHSRAVVQCRSVREREREGKRYGGKQENLGRRASKEQRGVRVIPFVPQGFLSLSAEEAAADASTD